MALFKCKMCGGTLEINNQESVATCEYCGMQQTLPKLDDERRANLYDRANHFRRNNEFDKAMGIYDQILNEDGTDAEAYWSLVLCRYGIEYVEDPSSRKRIPTVNRAQFTSIYEDKNYKSALQYADGSQRQLYEEEAKMINEIQKGILAISEKEEPFDIFICYKESDSNGRRTPDSVLAQDLYYQLKQEGFKVFFSRITLEDKIGSAYEPYIFAALNSAKVMVVLGTKPEHFNAVWVKNEWSRYLSLIKGGAKKTLIPAYRDMDPYDLPEEFSHLQAQDMSKLGFMQDLIRGIKKITEAEQVKETVIRETVVKEAVAAGASASVAPLLRRAFLFLEDGEWNSADEYFERVLDNEPENGEAYLGKLMAELQVNKKEKLKDLEEPFDEKNNYQKAVRFADAELQVFLTKLVEDIKTRKQNAYLEENYQKASKSMQYALTESGCRQVAMLFEAIRGYKDSATLAEKYLEMAETMRKDTALSDGKAAMASNTISSCETAMERFESISGWKDADELRETCIRKIEELKVKAEQERLEAERRKEVRRKEAEERAKNVKRAAIIVAILIAIIIAVVILFIKVVIPNGKYEDAVTLMEQREYEEAIAAFEELDGFKDSEGKIEEIKTAIKEEKYREAIKLMERGENSAAISVFHSINAYKDSKEKIEECNAIISENNYNDAVALMEAGDYSGAIATFKILGTYKDSSEKIKDCNYEEATTLMNEANYVDAYEKFVALMGHKDSEECASAIYDIYKTEKRIERLKLAEIGDIITFGCYEQDNDITNGKEDIEWVVLDKSGEKIFVISKYALASQAYHGIGNTEVTWETCSLRRWLNNDFMDEAFSYNEKTKIAKTFVTADANPVYNYTSAGIATGDQIFILSIKELNKYFPSDDEKGCAATAYAEANGACVTGDGNCYWWLRTPGRYQDYATYVISGYTDGSNMVDEAGYEVSLGVQCDSLFSFDPYYGGGGAVRPAMWIDLGNKASKEVSPENQYNNAVSLMEKGEYIKSYEIFTALGDYRDSKLKAESIQEKYQNAKLQQVESGDYIFFGHYEQDNIVSNGKENIEWFVLDVEDGKALVVSKYALDCGEYSEYGQEKVTWATSVAREWANSTFLNRAFSSDEKSRILSLVVPKDELDFNSKVYGEVTRDKIFFLSYTEVVNYFVLPVGGECKATVYATEQAEISNCYMPNKEGICPWWLRSPWDDGETAMHIECDEGISHAAEWMGQFYRPAMWIDLEP